MKNEKCKTCIYRAAADDPNVCDHILLTGRMRGCSVEECDRYEKGDRIGFNKALKGPLPRNSFKQEE